MALISRSLDNQPSVKSAPRSREVPVTSVPTTHTDQLSKCPAEIRNRIFEYALQTHVVFDMTTYRPIDGRKPRRAVQASFVDHARHEGLMFDHTISKWRGLKPPTIFALAHTNRQAAKDTLPMLYGQNTFEFHTLGCMNIFLRGIGAMRNHIRHIAISGRRAYLFTKPTLAFRDLSLCPSLQRLDFDSASLLNKTASEKGPRVSIEQFVQDIRDFLRAWHESHKDEQGHSDVLDVVKVTKTCNWCLKPYYRPKPHRPCRHHAEHCYTGQMATLLAQALA